jgi:hypothetical protein
MMQFSILWAFYFVNGSKKIDRRIEELIRLKADTPNQATGEKICALLDKMNRTTDQAHAVAHLKRFLEHGNPSLSDSQLFSILKVVKLPAFRELTSFVPGLVKNMSGTKNLKVLREVILTLRSTNSSTIADIYQMIEEENVTPLLTGLGYAKACNFFLC